MTAPGASGQGSDSGGKVGELTAAGGSVEEAAHDVGEGRLVATFADLDGNVLGLVQDPS